MGHKVHPTGIRLGIAKDWNSKWFAGKKQYAEYLVADLKVREMLRKKLAQAGISKILIERPANNARVTIHTARPGVVIGKRGEDIEKLRKEVSDLMGVPAHINVTEVRKPELDAQLVAESIAQQLERRIMFRRAMKRAVGNAMRLGALGIKVNVAGRLNGAEIARSEWYREGRVPLHTLRADIDYGFAEAKTTYGIIGIKVWVYKGEVFDFSQVGQEKQDDTPRSDRGERGDRADRPRGRVVSARRGNNHVATQANQVPQDAQGPQRRPELERQCRQLRRVRPEVHRARPADRAPDRSGPPLDQPLRQARRQDVDPRVPRQADHQEADRSPNGLG